MVKLLIIDTGSEEHPIYQALQILPFQVDLTICHHNTNTHSSAHQRLQHQAENFGVPLQTTEDLPELLSKEHPDRVLLIMESDEVKDYAINLMRDLTEYCHDFEYPTKIMICNPSAVNSLEEMIELIANAEVYEIDVWLNAHRRYASGVEYLYRHARDIAPLTQISSSIHTGLYGTGGILELIQKIAWHHLDLLCSIVAAASNAPELSAIPVRLAAEHSGFYRDAVSVSFAFSQELVGCFSASTNDKGNLGFREEMQVKGLGSTIELNASLSGLNRLDADGYPEIPMDLDVNEDQRMPTYERSTLGSDTPPVNTLMSALSRLDLQRSEDPMTDQTLEDPSETDDQTRSQRILLDFMQTEASEHAPTLLSCLPGVWTSDAIQRSIDSNRRIDRPRRHANARTQQTFLDPESYYVEQGMQLAHDGELQQAIDMFVQRIERQNLGQIQDTAQLPFQTHEAFTNMLWPQTIGASRPFLPQKGMFHGFTTYRTSGKDFWESLGKETEESDDASRVGSSI